MGALIITDVESLSAQIPWVEILLDCSNVPAAHPLLAAALAESVVLTQDRSFTGAAPHSPRDTDPPCIPDRAHLAADSECELLLKDQSPVNARGRQSFFKQGT